jgi:hypothetical protein
MSVYAKPAPSPTPLAQAYAALRARLSRLLADRAALLGLVLLGALLAFELFNYSTTEFALSDLLGGLSLGSLRWATILALAFAAIDFAGIAWLFTPRQGTGGLHSWYLVGAWLLAATMNAMLTWWSVSLALVSHQSIGDLLIGQQALLRGVPVFVAALVWLLRILLIGSFTLRAPSAAPGEIAVGRARRRSRPGNAPSPQGRVPARLIRRVRAPAPIGQSLHELYAPRAHTR